MERNAEKDLHMCGVDGGDSFIFNIVLPYWITRAQQLEARVMELTEAARDVSNSTTIDEYQAKWAKVENVFVTTLAHNALKLREVLQKTHP
jgi:hypothetical protein